MIFEQGKNRVRVSKQTFLETIRADLGENPHEFKR